ncbi:hypothetical protein XU18_1931 [Perkinsela sp. CCAP 1560/4]|nr:hypothetical protein XU18_1931 [Perkinsela sp. CCAP 1560/4]|eukprot:KNH07399.1 hypothetical protein XU18_1931 [Perkinsela sp. CCAP 1560/4]
MHEWDTSRVLPHALIQGVSNILPDIFGTKRGVYSGDFSSRRERIWTEWYLSRRDSRSSHYDGAGLPGQLFSVLSSSDEMRIYGFMETTSPLLGAPSILSNEGKWLKLARQVMMRSQKIHLCGSLLFRKFPTSL